MHESVRDADRSYIKCSQYDWMTKFTKSDVYFIILLLNNWGKLNKLPASEKRFSKVKVKSLCLTKHRAMKAYWRSRGIAPQVT
jgi:hypothetical protein